jgi:hypothetical protein
MYDAQSDSGAKRILKDIITFASVCVLGSSALGQQPIYGQEKTIVQKGLPGSAELPIVEMEQLFPPECVDFFGQSPTKPSRSYFDLGPLIIRAWPRAVILERPRPPQSYNWLPQMLRLLSTEFTVGELQTTMEVTFKQGVDVAYFTVAQGAKDQSWPGQVEAVCLWFRNSEGFRSEQTRCIFGGQIETVSFQSKDKVVIGGGDFEPPAQLSASGNIKTVMLTGSRSQVWLWQICYSPKSQ